MKELVLCQTVKNQAPQLSYKNISEIKEKALFVTCFQLYF